MRADPLPTVRATPMFRSRTALHSFALWLALSAVVLRSLIPVGFMPGWTGTGEEGGRWLIICPASPLSAALVPPAQPAGHHDHAAMMAAMAAADADPHAAHHGMGQMMGDMAGMSHDMHAAGMHAGHDPAQHDAHRIASEHQSCPFAGAVAPALPVTLASFALAIPAATLGRPASTVSSATASQRRLPPARAPPAAIDTFAA